MKNILKAFYVVVAVLLITILTIFYNFFGAKKEYKNVNLNIKKGTTFTQIYKDLKLNFGILDRVYLKTLGEDFKLKIGTYKFNGKLSKYEVLKKLKNKESNGIRVTIPEGFTKKQVYERLEALGLGSEEEIKLKAILTIMISWVLSLLGWIVVAVSYFILFS